MSLDPVLLPATGHTVRVTSDRPSMGAVRPFGMTCTETVHEDALVDIGDIRYDPQRQVNIDADGYPAATHERIVRMGTSTDTRFDNQWFVDKD